MKLKKVLPEKVFEKPEPRSSISKLELKSRILALIQSSTIHGYPKLFEQKDLLLKLIWALCFMASTGGCGYFVFMSIDDYLGYDVVTKMNIIKENPMLFPTVIICNQNPFMTSESNSMIMNLLKDMQVNLSTSVSKEVSDLFRLKLLLTNNLYSDRFSESQKKMFGFSLEKTLLYCSFNMQPCSVSDFEWYYDMNYGNCYKFNSGKNSTKHDVPLRYSTKEGVLYGLFLFLYSPYTESNFDFELTRGLHLYIQNSSVKPYLTDGISISTGYQTNFKIRKTVNEKVPRPYSECTVKPGESYDSYLYSQTMKSHQVYSYRDCLDLCAQKRIIEKCGCYLSFFNSLDSNTPCLTPIQTNCGFEILTTFYEVGIQDKCSECPVECDSESFEESGIVLDFTSEKYMDILLQKPALDNFRAKNYSKDVIYEKFKQEVIGFSVYYDKLEYLKIEQTIKTKVSDLIAGIGGTLGLFLGLSFLSFIEFIEIFVVFLKFYILGK